MRLFVDKLTNIDFSFLHPSRGVVGETWQVNVELHGELDEQGMVVDFSHVKKKIKQWLDAEIDHRLLVPKNSPCLSISTTEDQHSLTWDYQGREIQTQCPLQAITLINAEAITTESVALWCIDQLRSEFPSSVKKIELTFVPEHIEGPYYHYTHGLKKHEGNCQRIAHGHRSSILIWRDGELSFDDMRIWAERWQDIYVATQEDEVEASSKLNRAFRYTAQQGEFYFEAPRTHCYMMETDSTVELIAQHFATELKKENPNSHFVVKAFEGIGKGAIAES